MVMGFRGGLRELAAGPWLTSSVSELRSGGGVDVDAAGERDRLARATVTRSALELPDGTKFNRAPKDMRSWEIHATYRLAWHLAYFLPSANLAQPLANWLCVAQNELERRGEWRPELLPPQSM